jgi:glucose-1-phosphate adenylyltransferase
MMGADYYGANSLDKTPLGVGQNSIITNAIIDKNARVGENVKIENKDNVAKYDGPDHYIRDGIVIIPKNGTIADGTVI